MASDAMGKDRGLNDKNCIAPAFRRFLNAERFGSLE
jgi:hypothetical protein